MGAKGNGADAKMVTLTINGTQVQVPEGKNLVDAAGSIGVHVPHYCYHAGLSVPANCRICQVEVEGMPKPAFGCRTPVKDGMVVHTDSEKAKAHQQLVQEFLLANHPLDCPICDKAGECTLQNYYMDYGQYRPVMIESKFKKHKAVPIGPTIVLDSERCILCSRCVRFCDEVSKSHELGLFNRNNHTEIGVVPGTEVDNPYSGNLVDICPVGALGDRDFRFQCRVWYLRQTKSICPGCSKGCNIIVDHQQARKHISERRDHKSRGRRVMRLRPRPNLEVNGHWMCDEGRYDYRWHDENRLVSAAVREGDAQSEVLPHEAIESAAARVRGADAASWAVVLSGDLSNEELWLAHLLFRDGLSIENVFVGHRPPGSRDDLLRRADKSANTQGARALDLPVDEDGSLAAKIGQDDLRSVWAVGHDVFGSLGKSAPSLDTLVFQGTNTCETSMAADVVLPSATCFEKSGTFTNEDGRVQRFEQAMLPLGDAQSDLETLQRLGHTLGIQLPEGDAEDVFAALAASVAAFEGLSHGTLGDLGAPLAAAQGVTP